MNGARPAIPIEASRSLVIAKCCFGSSLLAVYLHGSAVAGGLRPNSDVDVLAIVDVPTTREARERLVAELMRISGRHPAPPEGPRPVELIVFHRADLATSAYPARSELVYGEWLRARFEAGEIPKPVSDPEFTLLLALARQQAIALFGPDPAEVLPNIPEADIRRAIGDVLPVLLDSVDGDEINVLLTLARMWRTLATGEFVSKDAAAEWAVRHLHPGTAALVAEARAAYLGGTQKDWQALGREVRRVADDLSERIAGML